MSTVSIIVPHFNDPAGLERCLAALVAQQGVDRAPEIVVVDNASTAITEEALRTLIGGRARLEICAERGAGPARNMGAARSTGEVLAFIDSDCVAAPRWLASGLAGLEKADVVGGHVTVLTRDPARPSPVEAYELVFAFDMKGYIEKKGFAGSGNLFVRRRDFERVGGFRKAVSEDVDWSERARAAGLSIVYSREAEVGHPARQTWDELLRKFRRLHSEMFTLARERPAGRARWLARTWAMPLSAVAHSARVLRSPALPGFGARAKCLATLYALRAWRFVDGHRMLVRGARGR